VVAYRHTKIHNALIAIRWFVAAASLPQRTQYKLSRRDISSTSRYGTPAPISLITASCLRASDVAASVMGQSTRTANSVLRGFVTPPPIGERSIVMSVSVCLCVFVCPRSYLRNYTSDLHQFFVHVTYMAVARSSSGGVVTCYVLPVYGRRHICS